MKKQHLINETTETTRTQHMAHINIFIPRGNILIYSVDVCFVLETKICYLFTVFCKKEYRNVSFVLTVVISRYSCGMM